MSMPDAESIRSPASDAAPAEGWRLTGVDTDKTAAPPASGASVIRDALCRRVAAAEGARLVVMQAPAGFGKTTAMLQLRARLAAEGVSTAWLTLDGGDNGAAQFIRTLGRAVAGLDEHRYAGRRHGELKGEVVETLLSRRDRFAIFLDGFEAIDEPAIFTFLRTLAERLPRGGQILIATRRQPGFGLARLRGLGLLCEIDADDLRFDLDEAERYFRLRGLSRLPAESVRHLHDKTEGWITGLWLASISIARLGPDSDFVERFSGSTRAIDEYLTDEVLSYQDEAVRAFMVKTSVLRHLNASLCQALVPDGDAAGLLARLEQQRLFLVPVSGEAATWRYHAIFSEYLRHRLAIEFPHERAGLHLAAARWYESARRLVPAIDHAIEAGSHEYALSLLAPHAQTLLEAGRMRLLSRWFGRIPVPSLAGVPLLGTMSVWATLFTRGPWRAAEQQQALDVRASDDPRVIAHAGAQQPLILVMQDRYDEALAAGQQSLARLPTCDAFADSVLCNTMANVFAIFGDNPRALRLLDDARRLHGDSQFNQMFADSLEGMLDVQQGRLHAATARFRVAVQTTRSASYSYTNGNALAGILYTTILYETNDLIGAKRLINTYLPLICDVILPDHMISGHAIQARIAFERREFAEAFESLTALERLGHQRRLPRLVASAKLERSRLFLLQGNKQAARDELDRAAALDVWTRIERQRLPAHETEYLALARLRWSVHFGDPRDALPGLQAQIDEALRQSRHQRVLRLRALQSLALQRGGKPSAALETLADVLRQASREGFVRLLVDEGEALGRLVAQFHSAIPRQAARRFDPALAAYVRQLLDAFGLSAAAPAPIDGTPLVPLTSKELQVLALVASGLSNSGISERLGISDSTVRTHLRNVNSKLDARSRNEAVAIGRRLDLIE
ncbi:MAG: LuxR C-terminal-related transcriptional regulator [Burkholderiaceae bacterium]